MRRRIRADASDFLAHSRLELHRLVSRSVALLRLTWACSPSRDLRTLWRLWTRASVDSGEVLLHPRVLRGQAVSVRPGTTDFATFRSAFVDRYHAPPAALVGDVRVVLDLGANVGYTAAEMAARLPTAYVHAVEMDERNRRQAEKNTMGFGQRVRCTHAAVWIDDAGVSYRVDTNADAYRVADCDSPGPQLDAPSITMRQLLDALPGERADFVKMDVEGAESVLLDPEHAAWLSRVRSINVEVHDPEDLERFQTSLVAAGFTVRPSTRHWSALQGWREQ